MRAFHIAVLSLIAGGAALAQTPAVSTVVNAASNLLPGLPNAGIAQGALMILYGTALGPPALASISAYPLPITLAGTSVRITIAGRNTDAILYYTSANQVAAIVPSTTPVGAGTVTVTYNGRSSAAAPITVVASNVGLYTVNSQGTGAAVVTFPDYSYVTPSNAVNPGETVILWANGLGPIPTNDAQLPVSSDMTNVPLEILIGGKTASILYRGRNSCCSSLDQINVTIPNGIAGCVTPMVLKIGALVSNTTTIPIAASGRVCTTNDPSTKDTDYQAIIAKSLPAIGQVALLRSTIVQPGAGNSFTTTMNDLGSAFFYKYPSQNLTGLSGIIDLPPPGSCALIAGASQGVTTTQLDAGAAITINGPNGVKTYAKNVSPGSVTYLSSAGSNYFDPGQYSVSGPGGPDVGSFNATITFPKGIAWTNQSSLTSVVRANGVTVNWTGGDPNSLVQISGQSSVATSATTTIFARFDCVARIGDGTFTIPPAVLLALPPTTDALGTLTVGNTYNRVPFTATGIDHGFVYFGTAAANLGIVTWR